MIKEINEIMAFAIVTSWQDGFRGNKGLYLIENGDGTYSGIDNSDLNCWCEDFSTKTDCVNWLLKRN